MSKIKIEKPIVSYNLQKPQLESEAVAPVVEVAEAKSLRVEDNVVHMHEALARPEFLVGNTYKVKTPLSDHALYITINDVILNQDTDYEQRRPFEMFINSKSMEHFQWIVALTRIISAVFRKGGDVTFLVEELRSVFDPRGGYFKKGGKFMPSLVAEIGDIIDQHLRQIGMIVDETDQYSLDLIAKKKAELEGDTPGAVTEPAAAEPSGDFPASATLCGKCHTKALVMMDGCYTCLSCGDSKCG
jgi:hypothetical protein